MQHLPIFVPAANLTKSPCNVRKSSDAFSDAQLEANIAAKGLRQNLIGLPVSRKKGHYRIIAGGRRLDAVHRLIEKGVFDAGYEVPVLALDNPKEAIETSLEENFFVQAMNPADTCRAFQDIVEGEGKTPEEIAIRFGLTTRFVKGRLALADLAEPVFDALRNGEITLTVAIAYASATSSRGRQAEVFELLRGTHGRTNVDLIRRELVEGTCTGADPKALLVGRDAYQAAGGRFHGDLFTDAETERWIDGGILDTLAAEKLALAAEAIREREGFAEVRVVPKSFVSYNETWDMRPVRGELPPLSAEEQARLDAIVIELDDAYDTWPADEDGDVQEEWRQRVERLEAEQASIENRMPVLSEEQKAGALAFVVIGEDGEPSLHHQLYAAPAADDEVDDDGDEGAGGDDDEAGNVVSTGMASSTPRYSQRLVHELAEMKRELLRIHIARDTRFALDLAAFWMADGAVRKYRSDTVATELRANEPSSPLFDYQRHAGCG